MEAKYRATPFHTIKQQKLLLFCLVLIQLLINLHVLAMCGPEFCSCSHLDTTNKILSELSSDTLNKNGSNGREYVLRQQPEPWLFMWPFLLCDLIITVWCLTSYRLVVFKIKILFVDFL